MFIVNINLNSATVLPISYLTCFQKHLSELFIFQLRTFSLASRFWLNANMFLLKSHALLLWYCDSFSKYGNSLEKAILDKSLVSKHQLHTSLSKVEQMCTVSLFECRRVDGGGPIFLGWIWSFKQRWETLFIRLKVFLAFFDFFNPSHYQSHMHIFF